MAVMSTDGVVKICNRANDTQVNVTINASASTVLFLSDQRLVYKSASDRLNVLNISTRINDMNLTNVHTVFEDLENGFIITTFPLNSIFYFDYINLVASSQSLTQLSSVPTALKKLASLPGHFVYGDAAGVLNVYQMNTNVKAWSRNRHIVNVTTFDDFSDRYLLSGSLDGNVIVTDLNNGNRMSSLNPFNNEIYALKIFSNGSFVVAGFKNQVYIVQVDQSLSMYIANTIDLPNDAGYVTDLKITRDLTLIMGYWSGSIGYYNLSSMQYIKTVSISQIGGVYSLAILGTLSYFFLKLKRMKFGLTLF